MTIALKQAWTVAEFLAWEQGQDLRHEFDGIRPTAMTGGTLAHDAVQVNLVTELNLRLRGKPCRVHGNSLKIEVMGSIRYPDAFVTCTSMAHDSIVATDPVVIFEVLSKGTARIDRIVKNREYGATASVIRYVMLEQSTPEATMFERGPTGDWFGRLLGPEAILNMPEIGIELPLADIYAGLSLSVPEAEAE